MADSIVVVGGGGFGREVLDVIDAINSHAPTTLWNVVGVLDDAPSLENLDRLDRLGTVFLGGTQDPPSLPQGCMYVVGIGSVHARRLVVERMEAAGLKAAVLVHPAATVGALTTCGPGTVLCAGARVTTNVVIGRHVHLNPNATVGHDTVIGDYVSINPSASISGDCTIEDDVLIGVAGVVLNGLTVGRGSTVGGSACVVRDVPRNVVVKGVPAR